VTQAQATGGTRTLELGGRTWHSPRSLADAFAAMADARSAGRPFRLLAGNTGVGVYKNWPDEPVLISLNRVQELRAVSKVQVTPSLGLLGTRRVQEEQK
jgi:xanthine dehydrogenase iron-sulfur cluster and FAD-binding subunit A